jgi:hypothetical protein
MEVPAPVANGDEIENADSALTPAQLKVQRTNWKKIAGNELLKIQSKIVASRQNKVRENWQKNREKNYAMIKARVDEDTGLSPHPGHIRRSLGFLQSRNHGQL